MTVAEIKFDQKLSNTISLNLHFRDENGKRRLSGRLFFKKTGHPRPRLLRDVPMLFTPWSSNGMVEGLQDMRWSIGKEYDIINVSIDSN